MNHTTPAKVLWATTLQPFVGQWSGSLAHGAKLLDQFLHQEPTPQHMATFECELHRLWREGGRRIVAWVLHPWRPQGLKRCRLACGGRNRPIVDVASIVSPLRRGLAGCDRSIPNSTVG
jgi:hypothetical protein